MKLSSVLKKLYEESEFTSVGSLSDKTGIGKGFIDRAFAGKNTTEKLDILFHELTKELTKENLICAIDLIKSVKKSQIEQDQLI
jgi:hypothetical protein